MARSQSDFFQRLSVDGGAVFNGRETEQQLTAADMDLTVEQQSELAFVMEDPNWAYFNSFGDKGPIGREATYGDLKFAVSSYSLDGGASGHGGTTLRLRARGIEKIRNIRGALTRENISPSQFIIDSARSGGMTAVVQDSPVRPSISRDVTTEGSQTTNDVNEWTTDQRLAAEEGFVIFESLNVLYFGSPQWLFDTRPTHQFSVGKESPYPQNWMLEPPTCDFSISKTTLDELSFSVPVDSAGIILPGHNAQILGFPFFKGKLLITSVAYPLAGQGDMRIVAKKPWVIEKQKTPEQQAAEQAASNRSNGGGGAGNSSTVNVGPGGQGKDFYAREICNAAKERNLGKDGARNGIATALVESNLQMYANRGVPASLNFPHDAVGSDHDSVGLFQQRQAGWGTLAERMNPRASAGMFFNKMMTFNWRAMDPGAACQRVQVSAFPAKYAQRMNEAMGYVNRLY